MASLFIEDAIQSADIVIFGRSSCPYTKRAKLIFMENRRQPKVIDLDSLDDGFELQNMLKRLTGQYTLPYVYINGKYMSGGLESIVKMVEDGSMISTF